MMTRKRINVRVAPAAPTMTRDEALAKVRIAGAAELRMSMNGRVGPHQHHRSWPDYLARAADEIDLHFVDPGRARIAMPSPAEADFADRVSAIINRHIADPETRLVLRARSMVHPIRETHVRSFRGIAKAMGKDHKWAQRRFERGLDLLCRAEEFIAISEP